MIKFAKGCGANELEFPITQDRLDNLLPCALHDPCVGNSHGVELPSELATEQGLIDSAKEVAKTSAMAQRGEFNHDIMRKYWPKDFGEYPNELPKPLLMAGLSMEDPAGMGNAVHMDLPWALHDYILRWIQREKIPLKKGAHDHGNFQNRIIHPAENLLDRISRNMKIMFEIKYYFGVARPEEVLGYNNTLYDDACPPHPSFGAGHTAAAAAGRLYYETFDMTYEQKKILFMTIFWWSVSRTIAGVHHMMDNIMGLKKFKIIK